MDTGDSCTESTETSDRQYEDTDSQKIPKQSRIRHRKKNYYNSIRNQMEFYFGDANLSKDRFLMQLIKENEFVPLDIFLKFNKLKKLVTTTEQIAKSLTNSELLELSDDKTKVRRKTEIQTDRNVDGKTIYVECLPAKADHDWVKNIFQRFGQISYISLPRFKQSKKIKEFGFIEFENEESVERAIKAFKEFNGVLSLEETELDHLASIKSFIKEKEEEENEAKIDDDAVDNDKKHKRRNSSNDNNDDDEPNPKRFKESSQTETDDTDEDSESEEVFIQAIHSDIESEEAVIKKKKRRKQKKKKSIKKLNTNRETSMSELKILRKKDWKSLRNKYLNLQRKQISSVKASVKKRLNRIDNKQKDKIIQKPQSMNFYCATQAEDDTETSTAATAKPAAVDRPPLFKYEPGLILKITLIESCVDTKNFKEEIKQYPGIKYVDIKEGAIEAFIRCETAKHTQNLRKHIQSAEYMCQILSGELEIDYWNKIMKDREVKLNKNVKVKTKRGREKIAKIVATHIRFEEED